MPKKTTAAVAENWLKENAPHIELLKWGGKATAVSRFLDKKRNSEFSYQFRTLKGALKKDPDFLPRATKEEKKVKFEKTCMKRFGATNPSKIEAIKKKKEKTSIKNYGASHPMKTEKYREDWRKNYLEKYGVDHPSKLSETREKAKETYLKNYGVSHPLKSEEVKKKIRNTCLKKYGVSYPLKSKKVKEKSKKTCLDRYGVPTPFESEQVKKRIEKTRVEAGDWFQYKGKKTEDYAKELGVGKTTFRRVLREQGLEAALSMTAKSTTLESRMSKFLKSLNLNLAIEENKGFSIEGSSYYRPDFFLPDFNLIIECDGLYWHSDSCERNFKGKFYHQKKLHAYEREGCRALFFRGDEIRDKFPIVKSIILNQIKNSKRIYARKLEHGTCSNKFFEKNHLMGKGQGRIYSLNLDDEPQAAIQVKWKNKKEKILEISRFCTRLNTSVVGGWSRILKKVITTEQPNKITTFVDRRYGSGEYLKQMGWLKAGEHISFKWTDFINTYHRMKFPGSSGYEKGLAKIWDCGQAKWELNI